MKEHRREKQQTLIEAVARVSSTNKTHTTAKTLALTRDSYSDLLQYFLEDEWLYVNIITHVQVRHFA